MEETGEGEQLAEEQQPEASGEMRITMRVTAPEAEHVRKVADYAAALGIIPANHRGNITAWINYCLNVGEAILKQQREKTGG